MNEGETDTTSISSDDSVVEFAGHLLPLLQNQNNQDLVFGDNGDEDVQITVGEPLVRNCAIRLMDPMVQIEDDVVADEEHVDTNVTVCMPFPGGVCPSTALDYIPKRDWLGRSRPYCPAHGHRSKASRPTNTVSRKTKISSYDKWYTRGLAAWKHRATFGVKSTELPYDDELEQYLRSKILGSKRTDECVQWLSKEAERFMKEMEISYTSDVIAGTVARVMIPSQGEGLAATLWQTPYHRVAQQHLAERNFGHGR